MKLLQKSGSVRPRLVAVVCSLNGLEMIWYVGNWQLNKTFARLTM